MALLAKVDFKPALVCSGPGVYIFRDQFAEVIYVGKAKSLRKRLSQYFQPSRLESADPKLRSLINSIAWWETHEVKNENEALMLESKLIKDFVPRYNVLLRDDKRFPLLKIRLSERFPRIVMVRIRKEDGAIYFGPFPQSGALRATVEFLERYFGLRSCNAEEPGLEERRHCKDAVLRACSSPCDGSINEEDYRARVESCLEVLRGDTRGILRDLDDEMKQRAAKLDFEKAAQLRDVADNLRTIADPQRNFSRATPLITPIGSGEPAVLDLQQRLGLKNPPSVIECFDNSNFQGTNAVSSMVRFVEGRPAPRDYRHFKVKTVEGPDDFATMREVVGRRLRRLVEEERPLPDMLLIDGGKGQLAAACEVLKELGLDIPTFGLAKQHELLFEPGRDDAHILPRESPALRLCMHLRDEAHRFAIGFHRKLRAARIASSVLDEVEGIGKTRREALLKAFGSVTRLLKAEPAEIAAKVPGIGLGGAEKLLESLRRLQGL